MVVFGTFSLSALEKMRKEHYSQSRNVNEMVNGNNEYRTPKGMPESCNTQLCPSHEEKALQKCASFSLRTHTQNSSLERNTSIVAPLSDLV